ncbi:MAG TPA: N-acetylglucosamine kinase, partial [Firmicutes bacterium]|nr:N-acetylglucosamine kinase [Bacillota bacterium]
MRKFVIGVDGGNTKTDYFLFDTEGNLIDHLKGGTCSHEALSDSFEGAYRLLKMHLDLLVHRNDLTYDEIESAAFGLAGVDLLHQRETLEDIVERIGFKNYVVDNDSFLGIKAALPNGFGVCSINGTGTVAGGIDEYGNRLQVGGMGAVTGDEAGGAYIAKTVLRYVYDYLYRCSPKTMMAKPVMNLLGV